nr:hypothetical transcript [Hymenolepis microstoma]
MLDLEVHDLRPISFLSKENERIGCPRDLVFNGFTDVPKQIRFQLQKLETPFPSPLPTPHNNPSLCLSKENERIGCPRDLVFNGFTDVPKQIRFQLQKLETPFPSPLPTPHNNPSLCRAANRVHFQQSELHERNGLFQLTKGFQSESAK